MKDTGDPEIKLKASIDRALAGDIESAYRLLDEGIEQAAHGSRGSSVRRIAHFGVLNAEGSDLRRARLYREQALPYVPDRQYALYNLSILLLRMGEHDLARRYATESLTIARGNGQDSDLAAVIVSRWPDLGEKRS